MNKYESCRHCDRRGEQEISECPSSHACECSRLAIDRWVEIAMKQSGQIEATGNYVADKEKFPTKVTFANGRTVKLVGKHLVIGWDRKTKAPK